MGGRAERMGPVVQTRTLACMRFESSSHWCDCLIPGSCTCPLMWQLLKHPWDYLSQINHLSLDFSMFTFAGNFHCVTLGSFLKFELNLWTFHLKDAVITKDLPVLIPSRPNFTRQQTNRRYRVPGHSTPPVSYSSCALHICCKMCVPVAEIWESVFLFLCCFLFII